MNQPARNNTDPSVIAWGEALWDCMPGGMFAGGAPFNFACHCARCGTPTALASAVGNDFPGRLLRRLAERFQVGTQFIATADELETGHVLVELDGHGNASYEIPQPVAWDSIPISEKLLAAVAKCRAVVFGSLAQRSVENLTSLRSLLEVAKQNGALRIFDVNLRPPFDDHALVITLARECEILKLNETELYALCKSNPVAESELPELCIELAEITSTESICVTLGAKGALWWCPEFWNFEPAPKVKVVDTVGAGDAFLAKMVSEILDSPPSSAARAKEILLSSCALAASVASHPGAISVD